MACSKCSKKRKARVTKAKKAYSDKYKPKVRIKTK